MKQMRTGRLAALGLVLALAGAGCGDEVGESIAENAIEDACEDEGVECDIDIDGSGVEIQTDEGSMTVDEDGNATIVGEDGEVVEMSSDDGDITMTDGDGSVVLDQDGDTMTVSGDDGDTTFTTGGDVPDEFPSSIELPDGATVAGSTVMTGMVMLNLTVPGELADVASAAAAGVEAAGYSQTSKTETPDGHYLSYSGNDQDLALVVAPDSASGGVLVSYSISDTAG